MRHAGVFETESAMKAFVDGKPKGYTAHIRKMKTADTGKIIYRAHIYRKFRRWTRSIIEAREQALKRRIERLEKAVRELKKSRK